MTLIKDIIRLYVTRSIPRASAALSYFLTMTFFPLIICLYALFGQNLTTLIRVFNYIEQFLTPEAAQIIREYLIHVGKTGGSAILVAAVTFLITTASAAVRVLQSTIGELQGGQRFRAWGDFLISFLLAFALLFAVYFSIAVMLTGHDILVMLKNAFSITILPTAWVRIRFLLLGSLALVILWGIFSVTRRRKDRYPTLPGAALATIAIVIMTSLFSVFISASARYSLVYGSLASLILLMFWLYLVCQIIFIGAAFNVALRDRRARADSAPARI